MCRRSSFGEQPLVISEMPIPEIQVADNQLMSVAVDTLVRGVQRPDRFFGTASVGVEKSFRMLQGRTKNIRMQ